MPRITTVPPSGGSKYEIELEEETYIQDMAENLLAWTYHLKRQEELNNGEYEMWRETSEEHFPREITGYTGHIPYANNDKDSEVFAMGALSDPHNKQDLGNPIVIHKQICEELEDPQVAGYVMHELEEYINSHRQMEMSNSETQKRTVRDFESIQHNFNQTIKNPEEFYEAAKKIGVETNPDTVFQNLQEIKECREYAWKMGETYNWRI